MKGILDVSHKVNIHTIIRRYKVCYGMVTSLCTAVSLGCTYAVNFLYGISLWIRINTFSKAVRVKVNNHSASSRGSQT
jgi:hypothetical protein